MTFDAFTAEAMLQAATNTSKNTVPIVAVQVQTLLIAINNQLQLISTSENNKKYVVPSNIVISYDKLTPEILQVMNEKLLGIYQELLDCVQVETIQPYPWANLSSPSLIPDNPVLSPLWEMFNDKQHTDLGRPHIQTNSSLSDQWSLQQSLYDEVNWLIKNPNPNHILALFRRCFNQEPGTLKDGVAYKLSQVLPTGETQDIIGTENIASDVDFLRTLLNFPLDQLKFEKV